MYTTTDITEHPNPVTNKHAVFSHHRQTFCRLSALFIGGIYTLLLYGGLTAGSGTLLFSVSQFVVEVTEWIFSHTCVFLSVSITERTKCLFTLHMQWDGYLHEFGSKTISSYNKRGLLLFFYHDTLTHRVKCDRGFHWLTMKCYVSSSRSSMLIEFKSCLTALYNQPFVLERQMSCWCINR